MHDLTSLHSVCRSGRTISMNAALCKDIVPLSEDVCNGSVHCLTKVLCVQVGPHHHHESSETSLLFGDLRNGNMPYLTSLFACRWGRNISMNAALY